MNWNDLRNVWSGQQLPPEHSVDLAALRDGFEAKRRRLARSLFWRDMREAWAGVVVSGIFAYFGWQMGRAGWPIAFAVVLLLGLTGFFVLERVRAHRQKVENDAPLLAKIEGDIAELRHQRRLLLNVATWYLGPCIAAAAILGVTKMAHAPIPLAAKLETGGIQLLLFALVSWGVWALNRRAVRKQIEPRLRELEDLRQALLSQS